LTRGLDDVGDFAGAIWRSPPRKRGVFLRTRLVESGGTAVRVRRLGGDRAGEIRITRFLRNPAVTIEEMMATTAARTHRCVAGRHVLAIQDTTMVRSAAEGLGVALHPLIAVDAVTGTLLGLVSAEFFVREGGKRDKRARPFAHKESRRWHTGIQHAAALAAAGAASVTVVMDREADIYEDFAEKPQAVELLVRASHDRICADGSRLFAKAEALPEAGRMTIELPAAPGRTARTAVLALRTGTVEIARPKGRPRAATAATLPASLVLTMIDACEIDPPPGVEPAHWRLLTTHSVTRVGDARRIVGFYRARWTIEQLFRTLKSQGFQVEALRLAAQGPFEKLVAATLIAAVSVLQLVHERDGVAQRPLADAFDPDEQSILETISASLEGKTIRQKNPHPKGSLAFAAWVMARLGGWTGYYGKAGPIVMLHGLTRYHAIKHGWSLRNV
jgi:hypothetical protein